VQKVLELFRIFDIFGTKPRSSIR